MDRFVQRSKYPAPLGVVPVDPATRAEQSQDGRPAKKPRLVDEIKDSDDEDEGEDEGASCTLANGDAQRGLAIKAHVEVDDDDQSRPQHQTAFENSLPAVATDNEAIEEYEATRASQASQDDAGNVSARLDKRQWVRGTSSIYVDAFNLALDTVLEDEAHLFDDKEKCVFEQWKSLSYEAQYLLVMHPCCCSRHLTLAVMCAYSYARLHCGIVSSV